MDESHVAVVGAYLRDLQDRLCAACERADEQDERRPGSTTYC